MRDSKRGRVPEAHAQRVIGASAQKPAYGAAEVRLTQEAATMAAPEVAESRRARQCTYARFEDP